MNTMEVANAPTQDFMMMAAPLMTGISQMLEQYNINPVELYAQANFIITYLLNHHVLGILALAVTSVVVIDVALSALLRPFLMWFGFAYKSFSWTVIKTALRLFSRRNDNPLSIVYNPYIRQT